MEKANLESFLQACESANITKWTLRFEGGNRSATHGNDDTRIILRDDDLIIIEPTHNYATPNGQFNITTLSYEMIDNVRAMDLTYQQTIDLLNNLSIYDEDMQDMIKHSSKRMSFVVGDKSNAGLAVLKDSEGNDVIPPGSSGYITQ